MMGHVRVTVLWEDQRYPSENFGPHELLLAIVFDSTDGDRYRLRKIVDGRPMKGDSKVLRSFREDGADITRDGSLLIAVLDDDRVRRLLGLPGDATEKTIADKVREGATAPPDLSRIVLLRRNVETIIEAAGKCDPGLDREKIRRAMGKDRLARDEILNHVAWSADRRVRDCIVEAVDSLAEMRAAVLAAL